MNDRLYGVFVFNIHIGHHFATMIPEKDYEYNEPYCPSEDEVDDACHDNRS
jgi:hypothetical protein